MKQLFMGVALIGLLGSSAVWAADKPVGLQGSHGQSQLSAQASSMLPLCASCHGLEGVSTEGMYPNLAGQKVEYLVKQLQQFKSRERNDPIMSPMAEPLSPEMVSELAGYFSSLK